ncbi:MAG: putative rane protein possible Na+ channel or pump [Haloplasmataceae bacterium]|nr:putative rane protein possible Na+ channel or pump [Haloplasmataceae bacterium]
MVGLGTIVNALAVIVGGSLGLFFKHNLKDKYKVILMQAIGLSTLVVGISGVLSNISKLPDIFILEMTIFMVIGSCIGTLLKIDENLNGFADKMQRRFSKLGNFSKGFVSSSIVFCVGAMAINGPFQDGLGQGYSILFTKSVLDGVTAMIFASTLGVGVLFSAIPILIYQGIITFTSYVGNIIIIGISLSLLEIKKINVANLLPAIFLPIMYYYLFQLLHYLF